jgi:FKBP-type peptidyl-prolyl cis-trans isomerase SlyD
MIIGPNTVVTLTFKASDAQGKVLEDGQEPRSYLHGGHGNTLPGIEQALEGQTVGFAGTLVLRPEEAFGVRDESLVTSIPKSQFPPGVKIGGTIQGRDDQGATHTFTVMKIKGDTVHLDGNHPLAGQTMHFTVKVLDVRAASDEEVAHGHAHGVHGHHH